MKIITDNQIRCVKPIGKLDANSCSELEAVLAALPDNDRDIILDMSECPYVSSAGIRIILKTKKRLQISRKELFIAGMVPDVFHVFEVAGLHRVFRFEGSVEAALTAIQHTSQGMPDIRDIAAGDHQLHYEPSARASVTGQLCLSPDLLSFDELGFALGFGSLSDTTNAATGCTDFFVSLETCSGFLPLDPAVQPDFRIISDPHKTGLTVCEAISFGHQPTGSMKLTTPGMLTFSQLNNAMHSLEEHTFETGAVILRIILNQEKNNPSVSIALPHDELLANIVGRNGMVHLQQFLSESAGKRDFIGTTFRLAELELPPGDTSLQDVIRQLTFENIVTVEPFHPGSFLENPVTWFFHAANFTDGSMKRLTIETREGFVFETHKAFLARLLYTDSSKLVIEPLHGGYSAQTYHVTSFDHEGRKMRPTVLKIAHRDLISRESERCQQYALPYIFNNCAVVLGAEHFGETMALRYNFVGIGGEASQLKWLTHYYHHSDIAFLEPLFDKIFLQILKPWYGQPVIKTIFPFKDHDPTYTFFPHIYDTVNQLFDIGADEKQIAIPEMDRPILNPYWFLKHEFARLRNWNISYPTGICHGDLNMQNILLDENMNVYLIDFSETKPRSVISDFARLEAIFLVDNAPIENDSDMADYLDFIRGFYNCPQLGDIPLANYPGKHMERVKKNAALTLKMRQYAFSSANGNSDPIPYYIALLEWILPIVCYTSLPLYHKRLSMIVSTILCEKVLAAGHDM